MDSYPPKAAVVFGGIVLLLLLRTVGPPLTADDWSSKWGRAENTEDAWPMSGAD